MLLGGHIEEPVLLEHRLRRFDLRAISRGRRPGGRIVDFFEISLPAFVLKFFKSLEERLVV
jgi:hypothetical protein